MKITTKILQEKQACSSGVEKFIEHFPSGEAEYQDVLDKLAELNDVSNADWLIQTIGKTDAVLEINGNVERTNLFFAGSIKAAGYINVDLYLIAGGGIEAGCDIKAGDYFGVFAGMGVRLNRLSIDAQVESKTKPKNLVSGFWVESSEVSK